MNWSSILFVYDARLAETEAYEFLSMYIQYILYMRGELLEGECISISAGVPLPELEFVIS